MSNFETQSVPEGHESPAKQMPAASEAGQDTLPVPTPAPLLSVQRDPQDGAVLTVAAGEAIALSLSFANDAPFARLFHLEVDQSPLIDDMSWCRPADPAHLTVSEDDDAPRAIVVPEITVAPGSGGSLACLITPPYSVPTGEYNLEVRVMTDDGEAVQTRAIILQVTPARRAAPAPRPAVSGDSERAVSAPAPSIPNSAPTQEATPTAVVSAPLLSPPPAPVVPIIQTPPLPPQLKTETTPSPALPVPVPSQQDGARTYSPVQPNAPASAPILTDLTDVTDSQATGDFASEANFGDAVARAGEPVAENPGENALLSVRPGETMLVRFGFTNEGSGTRTYVIDEDRSLPADWISLVQDQVNLSRHGSGAVAVRLAPPTDAEPGDYPFMVRVGPLGGTLTPRSLTLAVQALPAVKLEAKQKQLKVGPFGQPLDFQLLTERAGNCDTAFRIGVRPVMDAAGVQDPQAKNETETAGGAVADGGTAGSIGGTRFEREAAYETDNWRYLFDRELGSLRSPTAQRLPPPENIRLRLERKGIWWFGFKETHRVQVQAVPVTDPLNSGKAGNRVELTATRWRPYPVPGWLLASTLLLLLPILGGRADNFAVTNGLTYNGTGNWYVLEDKGKEDPAKAATTLSARLRWHAPWYAISLLRATANRKTVPLRMKSGTAETVPVEGYGFDRVYEIGPPLASGDKTERLIARFVPVRTDNKLSISTDTGTRLVASTHTPLTVGDDNQAIEGGATEVTIEVPRNGQPGRLLLKNQVPARQGLNINVWLAQVSEGFSVEGLNPDTNETSNNQILPEATKFVQIRYTGTAAESTTAQALPEITLVTTDKQHQVVRVKLKLTP